MPMVPKALLVFGVILLTAACSRPESQAQQASVAHLEAALKILEEARGDSDVAVKALDDYLVEHREEILQAKAKGIVALEGLSPEEQQKFRDASLESTRLIRERMGTILKTFREPDRILERIKQFH